MKYVVMLAMVFGIYFFLGRSAPVAEVKETITASSVAPLSSGPREAAAPGTNALKRPLDRTHEVLGQVGKRNGGGEF